MIAGLQAITATKIRFVKKYEGNSDLPCAIVRFYPFGAPFAPHWSGKTQGGPVFKIFTAPARFVRRRSD